MIVEPNDQKIEVREWYGKFILLYEISEEGDFRRNLIHTRDVTLPYNHSRQAPTILGLWEITKAVWGFLTSKVPTEA